MGRRFSVGSLILAAGVLAALVAFAGSAGAEPPVLVAGTATNPTYTTVHLSGEINAEGEETFWSFQVSRDGGANWEWTSGPDVNGVSTGTALEPVEGTVEGLRAGTTYSFRLHGVRVVNGFEEIPFDSAPGPDFTTETLADQTVTVEPVSGQTSDSAHFVGHIDPNAPAGEPTVSTVHWHFVCAPVSCPSAEAEGTPVPPGTTPVEVHADATDLEPNKAYEVTLVTNNEAGGEVTGGPVTFTTLEDSPVAQTIPAFVLEGDTRALVGGRINPRNSDTTYWVEYGPDATYGQSTPHVAAGSENAARFVRQQIGGLNPGATYHFRLVAENDAGTRTDGQDTVFTTPVPAGPEQCPNAEFRVGPSADLHDCRAYELVSPPDSGGQKIRPAEGDPIDSRAQSLFSSGVADDGDSVLWRVAGGLPGAVDTTGQLDWYRSERGVEGWHETYVGPPGATVGRQPPELAFASPDLRYLLFHTFSATIDPTDHDPVELGSNAAWPELYARGPAGEFTWLSKGPLDTLPPDLGINAVASVTGVSQDLSSAVFYLSRQLLPDAPLAGGIYQRDGQAISLVSKDPNGTAVGTAADAVASADGSVIAFVSREPKTRDSFIYLRPERGRNTMEAVGPIPLGGGRNSEELEIDSLSADGRSLVFSTATSLVAADTDTSTDLYRYDVATGSLELLTGSAGGVGNTDECATPLPGVERCGVAHVISTEDGSSIYFLSPERLVPGQGVDGGVNLYRVGGGAIDFVATLDASDRVSGGGHAPERVVRLSRGGTGLLIQSRAPLTDYDNGGHSELYIYDSVSGAIRCASCRPDGAPPTGNSTINVALGRNANFDREGDRVFFDSTDAVVPGDADNVPDVYAYDVETGAVALISSGASDGASTLAGNGGPRGRDVFFLTTEKLVGQDRNRDSARMYDARVGGGFPPPPAPVVPCESDACRGAASTPSPGLNAATGAFNGAGNPVQPGSRCRKGTHWVKRHGKSHCVKAKHKKHHRRAKKHGRTRHAKHDRRAGR